MQQHVSRSTGSSLKLARARSPAVRGWPPLAAAVRGFARARLHGDVDDLALVGPPSDPALPSRPGGRRAIAARHRRARPAVRDKARDQRKSVRRRADQVRSGSDPPVHRIALCCGVRGRSAAVRISRSLRVARWDLLRYRQHRRRAPLRSRCSQPAAALRARASSPRNESPLTSCGWARVGSKHSATA